MYNVHITSLVSLFYDNSGFNNLAVFLSTEQNDILSPARNYNCSNRAAEKCKKVTNVCGHPIDCFLTVIKFQ